MGVFDFYKNYRVRTHHGVFAYVYENVKCSFCTFSIKIIKFSESYNGNIGTQLETMSFAEISGLSGCFSAYFRASKILFCCVFQ